MRHARNVALLLLLLCPVARAGGNEYVFQILELHEKLATNEAFQQQAKLLGAYMMEAQGMGHDDREKVYQRVLAILKKIDAAAPANPAPSVAPAPAPKAPPDPKPAGSTPGGTLDAGAAHLEWFKTDSLDTMPEVPVQKALWTRDLLVMGESDLPPPPDEPSAARISFFLEAKAAGDHRFSAQHGDNDLRLLVGGRPIVDLLAKGERSGQGVIHLEKGFHRIDVLLRYGKPGDPSFAVSVLAPGATESRAVTKSDLLLKRE
jgi:hypothetical protein